MLQAKILEHKQITAKYGPCIMTKLKILQSGEDITIFSKTSDTIALTKTEGQIVSVSNSAGKWIFVNSVEQRSNEGLTPVREIIVPSLNTPLIEETINTLKLPMLSTAQKKELSLYIKQQSEMFKHINDIVAATMPTLKPTDHRAISMSIFIDAQRKINT